MSGAALSPQANEIRRQLEESEEPSPDLWAAAIGAASELAPAIICLLDKANEGVALLPGPERLLLCGLHALSAAREPSACPAFLRLLQGPDERIEQQLGLDPPLPALLFGMYDGNEDALYTALETRETTGSGRWVLFQVLARLVLDGRSSRERFIALLDRFDREEMARADDMAWIAWQETIACLGLKEFEERVRGGWERQRLSLQSFSERERREWLES